MLSPGKFIREIHPISMELRDYLEDSLKIRHLKKNDILLKSGKICQNIYLVESGLLRLYYKKDDQAISKSFSFEGQLCSVFPSFYHQKYGTDIIQPIEDTRIWYMTFEHYKAVVKKFPEFNIVCWILYQQCQEFEDERMMAMWMQRVENRYEWLVEKWGDNLWRIPSKYVSSYVGVTEAMISKIKSSRPDKFKSGFIVSQQTVPRGE